MRIVEHILQNNRVTSTDISKILGITRQAALKEMNKLVDLGVIELKGRGRGAYYKLV